VRPSTPAYRTLGRKWSLTILSPQQISTRSTQELKKTRSASGLLDHATQPNETPVTSEGTENDFELGFQFLN